VTRIHRSFAVLAATFCMTLAVAAAPAPAPAAPPDDPAKVAAAKEFIILAHPRTDPKIIAANVDKVMPRLVATAKKNDPKLDEKAYIAATKARMLASASGRLDVESQVVSRHFTLEELKGLSAFYASPLGRKLTGETPNIQAEMMRIKLSDVTGPSRAVTVKSPPAPSHK
jgi:hypothetical protein